MTTENQNQKIKLTVAVDREARIKAGIADPRDRIPVTLTQDLVSSMSERGRAALALLVGMEDPTRDIPGTVGYVRLRALVDPTPEALRDAIEEAAERIEENLKAAEAKAENCRREEEQKQKEHDARIAAGDLTAISRHGVHGILYPATPAERALVDCKVREAVAALSVETAYLVSDAAVGYTIWLQYDGAQTSQSFRAQVPDDLTASVRAIVAEAKRRQDEAKAKAAKEEAAKKARERAEGLAAIGLDDEKSQAREKAGLLPAVSIEAATTELMVRLLQEKGAIDGVDVLSASKEAVDFNAVSPSNLRPEHVDKLLEVVKALG